MINRAVGKFFCVGNFNLSEFADKIALVADLTAAFRIKRRAIQNNSRLVTVMKFLNNLAVLPQHKNFRRRTIFVAGKMFGVDVEQVWNVQSFIGGTSCAGTLTLIFHCRIKAGLVGSQIIFR